MTLPKGISMFIGALLLAWGIYAVSLSQSDLGELDYYSGALHFEENADQGAYDEDFDVYVESPYLRRKVEMLQFDVDKYDDLTVVWSEDPIFIAEAEDETRYNPDFPEYPKSESFYGTLSIGDEGVLLGETYIDKLSYKGYLYFENEGKVYDVGGIEDMDMVAGLIPADDYAFVSGDPANPEVGDIRVTWETIDPVDFQPEYSAAGVLKNGVLEPTEFDEFFYDYKISEEEIRASFEDTNKYVGIGMIVIGLLGILVPIFMIIKDKRNQKPA